ncbi:tRNA nucleotidyltransferase (CCA-adding enzyme) [Desulfosarcina sp. BuS5]|uniref:CBS domain-containing protein n=1 Tax=Desulfosarcina sp. BuS5 TaxID=933262 RepID=UPI0004863E6B|nr:CBS domain-containing protein [Desulfosarcina sp. BuS5]WDN87729.1 tRNA nucleotidyltransferase (CCA-adding enzyme) [Desulfosarcina sp. BuS5]
MRIVTTHKNTDFDALASLIAATIIYPDAIPVLPKNVNPNVKRFISIHKDLFRIYTSKEIDLEKVDSLVVVDINDWSRLEGMEALVDKDGLEIILWDHHQAAGNIIPGWKCHEEMGANITLMARSLKKEKKIFSPIHATLFMAGLYEDTGNLTFHSTRVEDVYAAAYFLESGADLNVVSSFLSPAYGVRQKEILFEMIRSAKRIKVNGYSICFNKVDVSGHVEGLAVVVRMCRELLNVDAAFGIFLNRERGMCIVIGRSNIDGINIGRIMQSIGGGGHKGAGSAVVRTLKPDAVEEMITDLIEGDQRSSVHISDLMSFPVFTLSSDESMRKAEDALREKEYTGIPVVHEDKLVGILSRRDFKKLRKDSQLDAPIRAFMSTNVIAVEPGKSIMKAAKLMVKHDIGRLPVMENGQIIGIITRSDVMLYFYDLLPD